ncbi:MAG: FAD-dependent oxidoreductase [Calditrichaceae bacterium]|nr:FAD-dependent oxidoreductase [Calditrichaceae bacterium]
MLKVGLLKEIKPHEGRVMLTPEGVKVLVKNGIPVYVESEAGIKCGFENVQYEQSGATILPTMEKVFQTAEFVLQVLPPSPVTYELFTEKHIVLSFMNIQQSSERMKALVESKAIFLSAEMLQGEDEPYPLLTGMSEIAGRLAIHQAAMLLTVSEGGKGKLLSGADIVKPATITIVGAGKAGRTAAVFARRCGANVNLIVLKEKKLASLSEQLSDVHVKLYSEDVLKEIMPETDVLIVAVHSLRRQHDIFIGKDTINLMEQGSVVIDISVEQTNVVETSHVTSHDKPTYILDDIVYYCVPNIAAAVPFSASKIITKKLLPFIKILAMNGLKTALDQEPGLIPGVSLYKGKVTNRYWAEHYGYEFYNIFELLELNL